MSSMVTLQTGEKMPESIVAATMLSLESLLAPSENIRDALAFVELVAVCRNSDHEFDSNHCRERLIELHLLQDNGQPHQSVQQVVLAAAKGEGLKLTLVSPVADS